MSAEPLQKDSASVWQNFGEIALRQHAALYAHLSFGVRDDAAVQAVAAHVRPGQLPSSNLFAAVHYLLRRGHDHPLKEYYRSLGGMKTLKDGDPYPVFRDFCLSRSKELTALISTRITNVNEIGRSVVLHAGFRALAKMAPEPLHLIEIGPSAGLNLLWDRYGVEFVRGDELFATEPRNAPVTIRSELHGRGVPPVGPAPKVARRLGLELNPVDLTDPEQRDWLMSLVWPEQFERFARMERAVDMFLEEKPEIRGGDALVNLPEALSEADPSVTLCVYHTFSIYQFSDAMKAQLDDIFRRCSAERPIWRLSMEYMGGSAAFPLRLGRYHAGSLVESLLATAEHTGAWINWNE